MQKVLLTSLLVALSSHVLANDNPFTRNVTNPTPPAPAYTPPPQPVAMPSVAPAPPPLEMEDTKTVIPEQKVESISLIGFSGKKAMLKVVVGAGAPMTNTAIKFIGGGKMVMVRDGQNLFVSGRNFKVSVLPDGVRLTRPNMKDDIYLYPDALPVEILSEEKAQIKAEVIGKSQKLSESSSVGGASTGAK